MIPVLWHLGLENWDSALPKFILRHAAKFKSFSGIEWAGHLQGTDVGVICIPGQHSTKDYSALNAAARCFKKVIFLIMGDEEAKFESEFLVHDNMKIWWFAPPFNPKKRVDRVAPFGWPTDAEEMIKSAKRESRDNRPYDWSFVGQVTHKRRVECVELASAALDNGFLNRSKGFTEGLNRPEYYAVMVRSKFVLCPSGPVIPDSFRFAEALEAGCVPVMDDMAPVEDWPSGYWEYVFGELNIPCPMIAEWSDLPKRFDHWLDDYENLRTICMQWWNLHKAKWISQMKEDLDVR